MGYAKTTRAESGALHQLRARRGALCALMLLPAAMAGAQYDPGATLDLGMGYGQNTLSQSAMRNMDKDSRDKDSRDEADYAGSGMTREARLDVLRKEYARRVAADGAASANAWATEMGRRDAQAERN